MVLRRRTHAARVLGESEQLCPDASVGDGRKAGWSADSDSRGLNRQLQWEAARWRDGSRVP